MPASTLGFLVKDNVPSSPVSGFIAGSGEILHFRNYFALFPRVENLFILLNKYFEAPSIFRLNVTHGISPYAIVVCVGVCVSVCMPHLWISGKRFEIETSFF